jgi:hypothetical protein
MYAPPCSEIKLISASASGRAPPFARLQYQLYAFAACTPVTAKQKTRQSAAKIFSFFILKNPFFGFSKKVFARAGQIKRKNYCFSHHIAPKLDFFIFMW